MHRPRWRFGHRRESSCRSTPSRGAGEERILGTVAKALEQHSRSLGLGRLRAGQGGADAFALSSRHEAQCLAVLEAAACGLPVAGTAVDVLPELVPEAAIATPPGDAPALADALGHLADEATREAMGQAARGRVEAAFALERCVERFWRLYRA